MAVLGICAIVALISVMFMDVSDLNTACLSRRERKAILQGMRDVKEGRIKSLTEIHEDITSDTSPSTPTT